MFKKDHALIEAFSNTDPSIQRIDFSLIPGIKVKLMHIRRHLDFAIRCNHLEKTLHRLQDHENQLNNQ